MKEMIYLKGKESLGAGILLILGIIVFLAPIILIFILRLIFNLGKSVKESSKATVGVESDLEKSY